MPGPTREAVAAALWPLEPEAAWLLENSAAWLSYLPPAGLVGGRALDLTDRPRVLVVLLPPADGQTADAPATMTTLISRPGYCRVCGCSQVNACLTESGPCWWVEEDLCSACVGTAAAPSAPPVPARQRVPARELVGLLLDTLRERGEHTAACERVIACGGDCTCGLDLVIAIAVDSGGVGSVAELLPLDHPAPAPEVGS